VLKAGSLKLRLAFVSGAVISFLLILAGAAFYLMFQRNVELYAATDLNTHFEQLVSGLSIGSDGKLQITTKVSDPRFEQPQGGLYWQVSEAGGSSLRSKSLWDEVIATPSPPAAGEEHLHTIAGPGGHEALVLERSVIVADPAGRDHTLVVVVAMDRDRVINAVSDFGRSLLLGLAALYISLLLASLFIVRLGLHPLAAIHKQVEDLRTGRAARIAGPQPEEVMPLTVEVNALVEAREKQLERARQRAGNLAHGLKTPLTVLAAVADELEDKGAADSARSIKLASGQMRDLVDRELARSRMALGADNHRAPLLSNVQRVVETLRRAPKGDIITWQVDVPVNTIVAMDATDLLELLGNLIDNARKHAKARVRVSHDGLALAVEDDGKGVPAEKLTSIARRGVKLDALAPGSGLGLAIVSDLADVYDFSLDFAASELGGLKVRIGLPTLQ
jgi:signal transduction histidine kinase